MALLIQITKVGQSDERSLPQLATVSLVINFKQKNKKDGRSAREKNLKKKDNEK